MSLRSVTEQAAADPESFAVGLAAKAARLQGENIKLNAFLRSYLSFEALPRLAGKLIEQKQGLPLFGATFAAKDNIRVKHQPLTFGLRPPLESAAPRHAAVIETLIKGGATLIGSTNLDPACVDCRGDNPYYGKVLNPRFRERIPAGSSAGSAAAVAADLCDFALGTDYGGSVRAPAAACCVYGLKCGADVLPAEGTVLLNPEMDSLGLFTPILDDLLFLFESGLARGAQRGELERPQLVVPSPTELEQLDEEMQADFDFVVERLKAAFPLQQLDFPLGFQACLDIRKTIAASDFLTLVQERQLEEKALPPSARALLALHRSLTPEQKETALDQQRIMRGKLSAMLDESTFILTPTLPARPPSWTAVDRSREALPSRRLNRFLALANVCSLPALSMPLEDTLSKFPFSLQIIGAPGSDYLILQAASLIKEAVWLSRA